MSRNESKREKQPKKRLLGAIFDDFVELTGAANTVEALRGDWSEIRKAWKTLVVIALGLCCAVIYLSSNYYNSALEEEKKSLGDDFERKVKGRDREVATLRFDLQNARAERDKAELEIAPWKDRAKKEFPFDDVTLGLAKLDAKVETVLSMFRSSIVHPLNEPINSATCTVSIEIVTDKPGTGATNIGVGGYAALCVGNKAGLTAVTINHRPMPEGKIEIVGTASVFDPFMGKPVSVILTAQYIQLGFNKDVIAKDTQILGGVAVWVINNRISLTFQIPPQKSLPEGDGEGSRVFIRFLRTGLEPLTSMTENKSRTP